MNPEQLSKSGSEAGEQRALFCWANAAERYGFQLANDMKAYEQTSTWKEQWLSAAVPELKWLHAIPNAGARGNHVAAAQLKAEGVKAGVADIFLPVPQIRPFNSDKRIIEHCGLYIELKRTNGKPSDLTKEQTEFGEFVTSQGYSWLMCLGWKAAAAEIQTYLSM